MKCPNCGREIPIHQQYCAYCGQKVEVAFDVIADAVVGEAHFARAKKIEQALMPVVALGVLANALVFFYNSLHTETPRAEITSIPALVPPRLVLPKPEPPDPLKLAEAFDGKVRLDIPELKPPPVRMLPERIEPVRSTLMRARGADPRVDAAIKRGVKFLKTVEARGSPLGRVNPKAYGAKSDVFLVSGTALAALGVLGNGESWLEGEEGVEGALAYLVNKTHPKTGRVEPVTAEVVANQALAALAVARGVLLTGDAELKAKAAGIVKGLVKMQDESGAWLRPVLAGRQHEPDLWRTALAVHALGEAKRAGFKVPAATFDSARKYAASTMNPSTGLSGKKAPRRLRKGVDITPFLEPTALAMACRVFAGEGRSPDVVRQLRLVLDRPPSADSDFDTAHIYLCTAAIQQLYERVPEKWMRPAADHLVSRQQPDGSWMWASKRGAQVGFIYPTAFAVMTLQCYFGR